MRSVILVMGLTASHGATMAIPHGMSLLDMPATDTSLGPHSRFTAALSHVREQFANATAALAAAGTSESGTALDNEAVAHVLRTLASGVESLRRVRAEVAASSNAVLPANVRMQLVWDIDRMVADAERLRSPSLAPVAREALMRALTLRFGVLLTPAFWTTPIKRDLIIADGDSEDEPAAAGSWSATPASAPEVDGAKYQDGL